MTQFSDLQTGETLFVDDTVLENFNKIESGTRMAIMVRPVGERHKFIQAFENTINPHCEELATESVLLDVTQGEYEKLIETETIEAVEMPKPQ